MGLRRLCWTLFCGVLFFVPLVRSVALAEFPQEDPLDDSAACARQWAEDAFALSLLVRSSQRFAPKLCCTLSAGTWTERSSERAAALEEAGLDDAEVRARLRWIEDAFAREARHAKIWWYGWFAGAALDIGVSAGYYARSSNPLYRDIWLTSLIGGVLWMGQLAIFPLIPAYASRRIARMPRDTPEERARALEKAEHMLKRAAEDEREGRSIVEHLLELSWAVGASTYIILRNYTFGEPAGTPHNRQVLLQSSYEFLWNVSFSMLSIWTLPQQAVQNYRARPWAEPGFRMTGAASAKGAVRATRAWVPASAPRGLSLRASIGQFMLRLTF